MDTKEFLMAVAYSFNPMTYKKVADAPPKEMFLLFRKTLFWSFMLMVLIAIPTMISMPFQLTEYLGEFTSLTIDGDVALSQPILIPEDDPMLTIDLSEDKVYEGERALLTKKYLYFDTPTSPKKINLALIKDPLSHKFEFSLVLVGIFILWLPSMLIYGFIVNFIKYFFWIALVSMLGTIIIRLIILSGMGMRKVVNICTYSLLPIMMLEILTIPFRAGWLFPILDFFGFSLNLTSIILHILLFTIGLVSLEKDIRFELRDRRDYSHHRH